MNAGKILHNPVPWNHPKRPLPPSLSLRRFRLFASGRYKGPKPRRDRVADWVSDNDETVRSLPIYVGGGSLLAVLFNRTVSGIAPVADASRVWESLSAATCCRSLVVVYGCVCILQVGVAAVTQAVILQPLGDRGIMVVVGNTIRGYTSSDQAWITFVGEKLDAVLGKYGMNS